MSWLDTLDEIRSADWTEASDESRERATRDVLLMSSYASAATAALVPIPIAEMALMIPIQSTMVMTIGHVHGRTLSKAEAKRVVLELGAVAGVALAGRAAITALKKFVMPGLGGVLAAPATFALTFGLGKASVAYFTTPGVSRDELKSLFSDAVKEGKSMFSMEAFERFRNEDDPDASEPEATNGESASDDAGENDRPTTEPQEGKDASSGPTEPSPEARENAESLRPKKRKL